MLLDLKRLTTQLHNCPVGHTIHYHRQVASTMPLAHDLAAQPETRSGALVVAEEQMAGRGRHERRWDAPAGQALLLSVILKPPWGVETGQLPMAVGVAVVEALERFDSRLVGRVGLKWPNDVLLGQSREAAGKVAGILIENVYVGAGLGYAILGIGINVNQSAEMLPPRQAGAPPPISMRLLLDQAADQPLDRTTLLIALCEALDEATRLRSAVFAAWRTRLWTLGTAVTVVERGSVLCQGWAIDVAPDGSLLVEESSGVQQRFAAGDVSIRTS